MSDESSDLAVDLVRWTFTTDPAHNIEIGRYLEDLGAEVQLQGEGRILAIWEEPEDLDDVIETIWARNGSPFEVTQEEFHRISLHVLSPADAGDSEAERAVA